MDRDMGMKIPAAGAKEHLARARAEMPGYTSFGLHRVHEDQLTGVVDGYAVTITPFENYKITVELLHPLPFRLSSTAAQPHSQGWRPVTFESADLAEFYPYAESSSRGASRLQPGTREWKSIEALVLK